MTPQETQDRKGRAMRADGGPFAILYKPKRYPPKPIPLTRAELAAKRNRDAVRARYHRNKNTTAVVHLHSLSGTSKPARKTVRHELTTPVNHHFCVKIASKSDSDITNRIKGRRL